MAKPITFVLSDDANVNNQGFRLMTDGADLSQFEKNPIMLYSHDDDDLPIGRWENIRKVGTQILADAVFDEEDTDAEVQRVIGKVKREFIKMASISSWPPTEWSTDPEMMLPGQEWPTATRWMAREASIVNIGANNNAMVVKLYDKNGVKTDIINLKDTFQQKPKPEIMNKKLYGILNLQDGAADDAVVSAVEAIITARNTAVQERDTAVQLKDTLTTELKTFKDKEKIDLVDGAIADKKFGADMRDTYLRLFDADPEGTKAIIEKMPKVTRVADNLTGGEGSFQLSDEQKKWSFRDWDKANKLVQLKDGDKELYKKLFKEEYNVDYKE